LATAIPVAVAEALAGEALLYAVELPGVLVGETGVFVLVLDDAAERYALGTVGNASTPSSMTIAIPPDK